jgi:hypothetical protein
MPKTRCVHFVGFRDDRYHNAVRIFGRPDFVHRVWDHRAVADVAPDDTVVFARAEDWNNIDRPTPYSFDDSAFF